MQSPTQHGWVVEDTHIEPVTMMTHLMINQTLTLPSPLMIMMMIITIESSIDNDSNIIIL